MRPRSPRSPPFLCFTSHHVFAAPSPMCVRSLAMYSPIPFVLTAVRWHASRMLIARIRMPLLS